LVATAISQDMLSPRALLASGTPSITKPEFATLPMDIRDDAYF